MTNDEGSTNAGMAKQRSEHELRDSDSVIPSSLGIRHSPAALEPSKGGSFVATGPALAELLEIIGPASRIGIDTEADSLHSYREKLCLLQLSVSGRDYIVDPLADLDFARLRDALGPKEIVLHGADYDLRMLRRGINFTACGIFDTVIAARLLGIREFSLAALVRKYFDVELPKGSQKANWAKRPLPRRMAEYALNDVHYLLRLADRLEAELDRHHRLDWFRQSCQRAIEQAGADRVRDEDEVWRIRGAGALRGRAAAVLRALWQWREAEAEAVDRPAFHILQNEELLHSAEAFSAGSVPDYHHFSERRRRAFCEAAEKALRLAENEWPTSRRRFGTRPTSEMVRRTDELRRRRDHVAHTLKMEPAFIAPRASLEAIATERANAETLLVPWQRQLLDV